jgi:transcriptional regulator GlxA family with amidase domain
MPDVQPLSAPAPILLAAAGLLNGRRATTHWRRCARTWQRHFPEVTVEADRIFVQDGKFWTSAGITAGIDLALALVEDDLGADVARRSARELVVHHRRLRRAIAVLRDAGR